MALANLSLLVLATLVVWAVVSRVKRTQIPKGFRAVPGPKGLPLIGNTLQLQPQPQRQFQQWARQYGELFQVQIGWENWVFVNSPAAVKDIFDKQSAITSGRLPMPVISGVVSGEKRLLLMNYSPEWRKLRAIVHKLLTPKSSETFRPSQDFEAKQLIYDILTDNETQMNVYMHVRRYTTSVVMTSTYGRRVPVWDCEDIKEIYGLMEDFSKAGAPGAFLADLIPPLASIPTWMQWWRPRAKKYYRRQEKIWMKYWTTLKAQMAEKKAPDCFVRQFAETDYQKQGISEVQAAFVAGTMIEAGSETTSSAINSCIKYLGANPSVQKEAHRELSEKIGDDRSPTFEDEDALPYIRAIVKEVLRIRPVDTIGSPHYTTADVTYKDYYIPKSTVVTIAQYALHFDPERWQNPDEFDPSRYLDYPLKAGAYAAAADPYTRDHFNFGGGRRICPGMHLAEASIFITIAKILWAFEIVPGTDTDGVEEPMDVSDAAYEDGVNTLPRPYKVRFVPRNAQREKVIREGWQKAKEEGFYLGNIKVDAAGMVL